MRCRLLEALRLPGALLLLLPPIIVAIVGLFPAASLASEVSVTLGFVPTELAGYTFTGTVVDAIATRIAQYMNAWTAWSEDLQGNLDAFFSSLSTHHADVYTNVFNAIDGSTELPNKLDNDNLESMWSWYARIVEALPCQLAASAVWYNLPVGNDFEDHMHVATGECSGVGNGTYSKDSGIVFTGTRTVTKTITVRVTEGEATETTSTTVTDTINTGTPTGNWVTTLETTTLTIASDGSTVNGDDGAHGGGYSGVIYIPPSRSGAITLNQQPEEISSASGRPTTASLHMYVPLPLLLLLLLQLSRLW